MAYLTKLYISYYPRYYQHSNDFKIVDVIKRLINLEELTIDTSFALDVDTLSEIVDTVKERHKVLNLKCNFEFVSLTIFHKNQKVRILPLK